jgi:membrane protein
MVLSVGFSYYVEHLADYTRLYGSVTAVVVTLLWLYMSAMVLILGAELNAVLRRKR